MLVLPTPGGPCRPNIMPSLFPVIHWHTILSSWSLATLWPYTDLSRHERTCCMYFILFSLKIRLRQLSQPLLQQQPQQQPPPPQLPQHYHQQKNHPNLSEYQAIFRLSHLANPLHWNVMLNPYMIKSIIFVFSCYFAP